MNIGHFRAPHTLVNPTHHITQNTLRIIVQFLLNIIRTPLRMGFDRHGQDCVQWRALPRFQIILHGFHIHAVIVNGMHCGRRW